MNPAFSVLIFTTLSGAGFGLWAWLGLRIALGDPPIGFQGLHGSAQAPVWYRNIKIKKL